MRSWGELPAATARRTSTGDHGLMKNPVMGCAQALHCSWWCAGATSQLP